MPETTAPATTTTTQPPVVDKYGWINSLEPYVEVPVGVVITNPATWVFWELELLLVIEALNPNIIGIRIVAIILQELLRNLNSFKLIIVAYRRFFSQYRISTHFSRRIFS